MKPVFDAHVHYLMKTPVKDSIYSYSEMMKLTGTQKLLFLSIVDLEQIDFTQNLKGLFYKNYFASDAYAFASLEPQENIQEEALSKNYLSQAEKFMSVGFDGMKMLQGKPSKRRTSKYKLSDKVYDRFYSFMEETGFPITMHNADPIEMWDLSNASSYAIEHGWVCDGNDLTQMQMIEDVFEVLKKHPKLHLTLAHFGFLGKEKELAKKFLGDYEYTMFDMTPAYEEYSHMSFDLEFWVNFITLYSDRFKYGTDGENFDINGAQPWEESTVIMPNLIRTWCETDKEFEFLGYKMRGAKFSQEVLDKLYMKNALNELKDPKKIDFNFVLGEIERLKKLYINDVFKSSDLDYVMENFR